MAGGEPRDPMDSYLQDRSQGSVGGLRVEPVDQSVVQEGQVVQPEMGLPPFVDFDKLTENPPIDIKSQPDAKEVYRNNEARLMEDCKGAIKRVYKAIKELKVEAETIVLSEDHLKIIPNLKKLLVDDTLSQFQDDKNPDKTFRDLRTMDPKNLKNLEIYVTKLFKLIQVQKEHIANSYRRTSLEADAPQASNSVDSIADRRSRLQVIELDMDRCKQIVESVMLLMQAVDELVTRFDRDKRSRELLFLSEKIQNTIVFLNTLSDMRDYKVTHSDDIEDSVVTLMFLLENDTKITDLLDLIDEQDDVASSFEKVMNWVNSLTKGEYADILNRIKLIQTVLQQWLVTKTQQEQSLGNIDPLKVLAEKSNELIISWNNVGNWCNLSESSSLQPQENSVDEEK